MPKHLIQARRESASIHIGARRWHFSANGERDQNYDFEECSSGRLLASRRFPSNDGMAEGRGTDGGDVATQSATGNRRNIGSTRDDLQGNRPQQMEEVKTYPKGKACKMFKLIQSYIASPYHEHLIVMNGYSDPFRVRLIHGLRVNARLIKLFTKLIQNQ